MTALDVYHLDNFEPSIAVREAVGALRTVMRHRKTGHMIAVSTIAQEPRFAGGCAYETSVLNYRSQEKGIFGPRSLNGVAEYRTVDIGLDEPMHICYEERGNMPLAQHAKAVNTFSSQGYEFYNFGRKNLAEWKEIKGYVDELAA